MIIRQSLRVGLFRIVILSEDFASLKAKQNRSRRTLRFARYAK
jgi:hypothetical protein